MKLPHLMPWACIFLLLSCIQTNREPTKRQHFIQPGKAVIAIQPFETVDSFLVQSLINTIQDSIHCQVVVLKSTPLPASAWFPERSRYVADSLLIFLKRKKPACSKIIIGVCNKDISTWATGKGNWGVWDWDITREKRV
jgi:hypothetical protein